MFIVRPRQRSCRNMLVAFAALNWRFQSRFQVFFCSFIGFIFCLRIDLGMKNAMLKTAYWNSIWLRFYGLSNFAIFRRNFHLSGSGSDSAKTLVHEKTYFPLSDFNEISYIASLLQYLESFFSEFRNFYFLVQKPHFCKIGT